MRILLIDNYDSFTFNLYQQIGTIGVIKAITLHIDVARNNAITIEEIRKRKYDRIVLSPGPGNPQNTAYFGVCRQILLDISRSVKTLGVCLGMQGMAHVFGGNVMHAAKPMHGKTSSISHNGTGVFAGLPQHLRVMRYHSLIVEKKTLPSCLVITATAQDSAEIMGLVHTKFPIEGVQFHPESFTTACGQAMMANFLYEK